MANSVTGGCVCGAVRYECTAEPLMTGNCHCRDCQRASGGAYVPILMVPRNAVKITGEVKYYDVKGASGKIASRGFCPTCGARLFGKPEVAPDILGIFAGSLDDPSWYRPGMDIWTSSAQPWDHMNPELPKFPEMPPMS
ncbi:MAG: GFA family protein [Candidatus Binatia bacterium]